MARSSKRYTGLLIPTYCRRKYFNELDFPLAPPLIPACRVFARYTSSLQNLVRLAPRLTELRVLDNSVDADRKTGGRPNPKLVW